ncbi:MAG TPA: hypothetical protein VFA78_06050 [Chloroflexota bacterium]|nr:hypothetical protein [Chloroflexota bacterium]
MRLLSGKYLFANYTTPPSWPYAVLTGFLVLLLLASVFVYWRRAKLVPDNPPLRRAVRGMAEGGMWIAGTGLFLALMRYLEIPYIDMPVLMLVLAFIAIFVIAYWVYDLSERYPLQRWQYETNQVQQRYRPQARRREEPVIRTPGRQRGKQRRARSR